MESKQEYLFEDRSVVRPVATRTVFRPLFSLVPRWLTANSITLLGFASTLGMVLLVLLGDRLPPGATALLCFTALVAYAVADHLDGMQALASGTASALGEFLDHFLDALSGAFMAYVGLSLMPGVEPAVGHGVVWAYLLAFIATYQERADCRRLHFARVGALEGLVILGSFFLTSSWAGGRLFWNSPLAAGLPGYWIIVGIAYTVFLGTVVVVLVRMGRVPPELAIHAGASALLVAGGAVGAANGDLGVLMGWALLTFHGVEYLARAMQPHLFGGAPRADRGAVVAVVLVLVATTFVPGVSRWMAWLALAYLVARAGVTVRRVLESYGDQWIWVNPAEGPVTGR